MGGFRGGEPRIGPAVPIAGRAREPTVTTDPVTADARPSAGAGYALRVLAAVAAAASSAWRFFSFGRRAMTCAVTPASALLLMRGVGRLRHRLSEAAIGGRGLARALQRCSGAARSPNRRCGSSTDEVASQMAEQRLVGGARRARATPLGLDLAELALE
jgi:hypothetical protein